MVFGELPDALQLENHVVQLLHVEIVLPDPLKLPQLSPGFFKSSLSDFIIISIAIVSAAIKYPPLKALDPLLEPIYFA